MLKLQQIIRSETRVFFANGVNIKSDHQDIFNIRIKGAGYGKSE
ncbi:hypothetical protein J699_00009 [Acinetobacter sp. 1000160]|nr:hypothetical protein J522_1858 [Acinetobacter baumannii 146457]EYT23831.1 hypothetical protein J699_00009 [Acinetobacter sp. 1000160]